MTTSRRGFLKGLFAAACVVAIEVKLSNGTPVQQERDLRWGHANDRYDYGIDPKNPLDVAIYDKQRDEMIDAKELMDRWSTSLMPPGEANTYNDHIDQAYEATAIIAMSQGSLLFNLAKEGNVRVMVPEHAWDTINGIDREDKDFSLPWIATAAA